MEAKGLPLEVFPNIANLRTHKRWQEKIGWRQRRIETDGDSWRWPIPETGPRPMKRILEKLNFMSFLIEHMCM